MEWWQAIMLGALGGISVSLGQLTWRVVGPSVRYLWDEWRHGRDDA